MFSVFSWNGRSGRKKYFLTLMLIVFLLMSLDIALKNFSIHITRLAISGQRAPEIYRYYYYGLKIAPVLVYIFMSLPNIVRRFHDLGKSATYEMIAWAAMIVVPNFFLNVDGLSGIAVFISWCFGIWLSLIPGDKGANKYGADPLEK